MADELKIVVGTEVKLDKAQAQQELAKYKNDLSLKVGGVDLDINSESVRKAVNDALKGVNIGPITLPTAQIRDMASVATTGTRAINEVTKALRGMKEVSFKGQSLGSVRDQLLGMGLDRNDVSSVVNMLKEGSYQIENIVVKTGQRVADVYDQNGKRVKDAYGRYMKEIVSSQALQQVVVGGKTKDGLNVVKSVNWNEQAGGYRASTQYGAQLSETGQIIKGSGKNQIQQLEKLKREVTKLESRALRQNNPLEGGFAEQLKAEIASVRSALNDLDNLDIENAKDRVANLKNLYGELKASQNGTNDLALKSVAQRATEAEPRMETMRSRFVNLTADLGSRGMQNQQVEVSRAYQSMQNAFKAVGQEGATSDQWNAYTQSVRQFTEAMNRAKDAIQQFDKSGKQAFKEASAASDFTKTMDAFSKIKDNLSSAGLTGEATALSNAFTAVESALNKAQQSGKASDWNQYAISMKNYKNELQMAKSALKDYNAAQSEQTRLAKAQKAAQRDLIQLERMQTEWTKAFKNNPGNIERANSIREMLNANDIGVIQQGRDELKKFRVELLASGQAARSTGDQIKHLFTQFTSWFSVSQIVMTAIRGIGQAVENVKAIDSAMESLEKVTNATSESYDQFLDSARDKARNLSTSITDVIDATSGWSRLGYSMQDAAALGEWSTIYKNVGDNVDSAEAATKSLVSITKAFGTEGKSMVGMVESVVDRLNAVGNKTSISSGEIGISLQNSAAALSNAGNSLSQAMALTVGSYDVTQDAAEVGNMWKTVSLRLTGAKATLEAMGEDTEGMITSTSKLRDQIKGLTGGFDIMKDKDTFKSTYDIIIGLGEAMKDMSQINKQSLLEIIAGKNRANAVAAALNNIDEIKRTYEIANNAQGSAMEEYGTYLNHIEAKQKRLEASMQAFSASIIDTNMIKGFYDSSAGILDFFTSLTDALGSIPSLAAAAAAGLSLIKNIGIFSTKRDELGNVSGFIGPLGQRKASVAAKKSQIDTDVLGLNRVLQDTGSNTSKKPLDELTRMMSDCSKAAIDFAHNTDLSKESINSWAESSKKAADDSIKFSTGIKRIGTSLKNLGMQMGAMFANMLVAAAVSAAIGVVIDMIDKAVNAAQYAKEALDDIANSWDEIDTRQKAAQKTLAEYGSDYERLSKGVNPVTGKNQTLSEDEYKRYIEANAAIADSALTSIEGVTVAYDEQGNAIVRLTGSAQTLADVYDQLAQQSRNEILGADVMGNWSRANGDAISKYEAAIEEQRLFNAAMDRYKASGDIGVFYGLTANVLGAGEYSNLYKTWATNYTNNPNNRGKDINERSATDEFVQYLQEKYTESFNAIVTEANSTLDMPRRVASTVIEDALARNADRYTGLNDNAKRALTSAAWQLDATYFIGKSQNELRDAVQQDFLTPILTAAGQEAVNQVYNAQSDFYAGKTTYSAYQNAGSKALADLTSYGMADVFIKALGMDTGIGGENAYQTYYDHLAAIVDDEDQTWMNAMTRAELDFAQSLSTPANSERGMSMAEFEAAYAEYLKEQALDAETLSDNYQKYTENYDKALEILKSVGTKGALTAEQYKTLQTIGYGDAVSGASGYLTLDYGKLRQLNATNLAGKKTQVDEALAANKANLAKEVANLNELYTQYLSITDGDTSAAEEAIAKSREKVIAYQKEGETLRVLSNEIQYASSAYKQWLDVQNAGEKSDAFKAAKSAISDIREGDKSGRKNTYAYQAAQEYILGSGAGSMSAKEREAALTRAESLYDKNGNFDLNAWRKASLATGAQDKNGNWTVGSIEEYAKKMGLSKEYTAQAILALSEYNGSYGVDVSQALIDEAKSILPATEIDANTQAILDLTAAINANTEALTPNNGGEGGTSEGGAAGNGSGAAPVDAISGADTVTNSPLANKIHDAKQALTQAIEGMQAYAKENPVTVEVDTGNNLEEVRDEFGNLVLQPEVPNLDALIEPPKDQTIPVDADTSEAKKQIDNLDKQASEPQTKQVTVQITETYAPPKGGGGGGGAKYFVKEAYSSGTDNAPGGPSLVGEVEPEIVVDKKHGKWFVAENPQLVDLNKGDIVFNGKETKDILSGRNAVGGRSYASGAGGFYSFFQSMVDIVEGKVRLPLESTNTNGNTNGPGDGKSGKRGDSAKEALKRFEKLYDWIQQALKVAQKKTQQLIDDVKDFVGYVQKNNAVDKAIASTIKERQTNEAAYLRYMQQAEEVRTKTGLADDLVEKIQNGDIDINEYDDTTKKKIEQYKKWYDLAEKCKDSIEDLKDQERELNLQRLDNIISDYENRIDVLKDKATKRQNEIKLMQAQGRELSEKNYTDLITNAQNQVVELERERNTLEKELLNQVAKGTIKEGSDEWHKYRNSLEEVDNAIIDCKVSMQEFSDAIYDLRMDRLENAMSALQRVQSATESLMELHNAQNTKNAEGYYATLIGNGFQQIENIKAQNELLRQQMEGLDEESEKYQTILEEIAKNEESIASVKIAQEQWNDAIADLKIDALQEQRDKLQEVNDEYQKQLDYEEALAELDKAKNQRNKLVFRNGIGFRYEADQQAIDEAQKRVDELDYQAKIDALDKQIGDLENAKETSNIYNYTGTALTNGIEVGSTAFNDMVESLINAPINTDMVSSAIVSNADAEKKTMQSIDLKIGDIIIQKTDDADQLAKNIVDRLPDAILQEMYKK